MNISTRVALLTVGAGLSAFLLSRVLWPPAPRRPAATAGQLPWFLLLGVLEALVYLAWATPSLSLGCRCYTAPARGWASPPGRSSWPPAGCWSPGGRTTTCTRP